MLQGEIEHIREGLKNVNMSISRRLLDKRTSQVYMLGRCHLRVILLLYSTVIELYYSTNGFILFLYFWIFWFPEIFALADVFQESGETSECKMSKHRSSSILISDGPKNKFSFILMRFLLHLRISNHQQSPVTGLEPSSLGFNTFSLCVDLFDRSWNPSVGTLILQSWLQGASVWSYQVLIGGMGFLLELLFPPTTIKKHVGHWKQVGNRQKQCIRSR